MKPLLHTWSLSVEEQFYLLFPFLLIALGRMSRNSRVPAILLLAGVSFGASVGCSYWCPTANFYLLPTRAWELLIGAFLAAVSAQRLPSVWLTESLCSVGLLAVLCAVFFYGRATRFPGLAALLPCGGTALIIGANGEKLTRVGRVLATRPLVFIGLISYSLYLWHWPMLVFARYWSAGPLPRTSVCCSCSRAWCWPSYRGDSWKPHFASEGYSRAGFRYSHLRASLPRCYCWRVWPSINCGAFLRASCRRAAVCQRAERPRISDESELETSPQWGLH